MQVAYCDRPQIVEVHPHDEVVPLRSGAFLHEGNEEDQLRVFRADSLRNAIEHPGGAGLASLQLDDRVHIREGTEVLRQPQSRLQKVGDRLARQIREEDLTEVDRQSATPRHRTRRRVVSSPAKSAGLRNGMAAGAGLRFAAPNRGGRRR